MKDMKSCCFTGHRIIKADDKPDIFERTIAVIRELYERGITNFICGGALGFDMVAADAVIYLREYQLRDITLELVLPCRDQDMKWKNYERKKYAEILKQADKITYIAEKYSPECMVRRNRLMVDKSIHCVAYIYKNFGGAASTVRYANDSDKQLTLI